MSEVKMNALLYCLNCDKETKHTIAYVNDKIEEIQCKECGIAMKVDHDYVEKHFKEEIINRVLSKPVRMTKEMEEDITVFFSRLPYRVISKPYRLIKEMYTHKQDEK